MDIVIENIFNTCVFSATPSKWTPTGLGQMAECLLPDLVSPTKHSQIEWENHSKLNIRSCYINQLTKNNIIPTMNGIICQPAGVTRVNIELAMHSDCCIRMHKGAILTLN